MAARDSKAEKSALVTAAPKRGHGGDPKFEAGVRARSSITLGEAKAYAAALSKEQLRFGTVR
jgi:hypothetical protein